MSATPLLLDTEYPDEYHRIPVNDMREHDLCGSCWCKPAIERHDGGGNDGTYLRFVWYHHPADGRQHYLLTRIPLQ